MARSANATYPQKIACLIKLAADSGHPFICPECGRPILPGQAVQFDHRQAVGRGGDNRVEDLAPVHAAQRGTVDGAGNPLDCHDRKTFRPRGGATTLGGDNYEAKKTTRLADAAAIIKPDPGMARAKQKKDWPSHPLRSRSTFPKRLHAWPARGSRPMNRKRRAGP
jgi:hypothetical protein